MQLSRGRLFLLASLAIVYASYLAWYHCPYAGGSDSSGYLNSARLLLAGRFSTPLVLPADLPSEVLSGQYFFPLGFVPDPAGQKLLPTYPVGLPLLFAAAGYFVGLGPGTTVVALAAALGFVLLLYLTAREFGVRPAWAIALAGCGALSPLSLLYALQPMSDLVAATWILLVVFCALRSARYWGWAILAGTALAVAVLVRPTNLLVAAAALVALQPRPRTWLAFVAGGLPGAAFLVFYNHSLYGRIVTTGYGDVSSLFAWKNMWPTLGHYAIWIPVVAGPLVLAALALPWLRLEARRKSVLLLWGGVFVLFYSTYECSQETWWYLRFILPALPATGIAAALALQEIRYPAFFMVSRLLPDDMKPEQITSHHYLRIPLTLVLCLATAGWLVWWDRYLHIRSVELDERAYRLAGQWAAEHLPPNSPVVGYQASGAILYYANRTSLNFNLLTSEDSTRFRAWLDREHRPLYAVLFPFEEALVRERLPGRWEVVTHIRQATVWRRLGPGEPTSNTLTPSNRL